MMKKIMVLVGLTVLAIAGAVGVLWSSMVFTGGEIRSLNDINETYRVGSGFSKTHTLMEPAPNGTLGTTVFTTITASEPEVMEGSLKVLVKDIQQVSGSELVNLNLTINYNMNHSFRLTYYPKTPADYGSPEFTQIINLYKSVAEKEYTEFTLTIYPTHIGKSVTGTATDTARDTNLETQQPELVNNITEHVGLNSGDVYDITYTDKQSETSPVPGFVGFGIRTFYTSEIGYQNAMKVDFAKINAFRSGGNSFMGASFVKFTRTDNVADDQLVVVIPEADETKLGEISTKMGERAVNRVNSPTFFTIYVRYSLDGDNVLTFRHNYAY